jgi:rubrerythrin
MEMKDILEERLEELGISKYEVAKRIAEKEGKKPTAVSTRVLSTFEDPGNRKYANLLEVIEVLGGRVVVEFPTVVRRVAS